MLAYVVLDKQQKNQPTIATTNSNNNKDSNTDTDSSDSDNKIHITHSLIESCVGLFKIRRSHRNAMDFDGQYIKNSIVGSVLDSMSKVPKAEPK